MPCSTMDTVLIPRPSTVRLLEAAVRGGCLAVHVKTYLFLVSVTRVVAGIPLGALFLRSNPFSMAHAAFGVRPRPDSNK